MKSTQSLFFACFSVLALTAGCESKFAESSPEAVKLNGVPLETRMSQKTKVDSRIDALQNGVAKAKRIIELFQEVQDPKNAEEIYSPIDFLIDANNTLKSKLPENIEGKLVRRAKLTLPFAEVSDKCKTVDALLEATVIFDETGAEKIAIGDRLTYSLLSCESNGEYLPSFSADWTGQTFQFHLYNDNLEAIFKNLIINEALEESKCTIKQDEKNILEAIACENVLLKLNKSETALIKTMSFSSKGYVRFKTQADIYENLKKKSFSQTKVLSNGQVLFSAKKVVEPEQSEIK